MEERVSVEKTDRETRNTKKSQGAGVFFEFQRQVDALMAGDTYQKT